MGAEEAFNPLDKRNLGQSVAEALLGKPSHSLQPAPFTGAGIYAIYYSGPLPLYAPISKPKSGGVATPIYVGKAVPEGARKGGYGLGSTPGFVLHRRLAEHAKSVEQAKDLSLADFACKCLIVDDIWIPLGESLLIEQFKPLWNMVVDGFGNHDPGSGRYKQQQSPWDILHPGRPWAAKCAPGKSRVDIENEVIWHFKNQGR